MSRLWNASIGGAVLAALIAATPFTAPEASAEPGYYGAQVYQAGGRWQGGKNWNRNWNGGRYYYNRGWNGGWGGNYWVGPAIGFGAGVLLGGALAAPRYYAPRYAPAYGNRNAYCAQKYRSYNPYTGTYTGYDGRQHPCRIP